MFVTPRGQVQGPTDGVPVDRLLCSSKPRQRTVIALSYLHFISDGKRVVQRQAREKETGGPGLVCFVWALQEYNLVRHVTGRQDSLLNASRTLYRAGCSHSVVIRAFGMMMHVCEDARCATCKLGKMLEPSNRVLSRTDSFRNLLSGNFRARDAQSGLSLLANVGKDHYDLVTLYCAEAMSIECL
ncbi:hypothetical protein BDW22DRAFT_73398 [Trametopsis cervina]|nr:hypothetical protein BDW22DRAFT_73398 [Trametopsis cervina]